MRKLTIKRAKSFVGCLAKMKIYIEDASANELVINNVPCRKLGTLKNKEEKTFEIGEEQAKVFVIADKLSKDYCNEFYQLPAGEEDVFLSGKNKFNPAVGNAFLFDNNENEAVQANREKGTKKGLVVLCVALCVGALVGTIIGGFIGFRMFFSQKVEEKAFAENGMRITLTNEFREAEMENYTNCYDSAKVAVFALKEPFTMAEGFGDLTLEQYGQLILEGNKLTSSTLKTVDGLTGFEYEFTNSDTKDTYQYFAYVFKTDDAFWLVQFATLTENVDAYSGKIIEWAKNVSFE